MSSIFTKIINGEIPCHKIAESSRYLAFLDINPLVKGHTLVIPKEEVDYVFDLNDDLLGGLMIFSKKVAKAIENTIPLSKDWCCSDRIRSTACSYSFGAYADNG